MIYNYYKVKLDKRPVVLSQKTSSVYKDEPFAGSYVFAQRMLDGPLKSRGLFLKVSIKINQDGTLALRAFDSKVSGDYKLIGQHFYMDKETGRSVYLKQDQDGKQYVIMNMNVPLQTLERLGGKEIFMEFYVRPFIFGMGAVGCLYAIVHFFLRKRMHSLEKVALHAQRLSYAISLLILLVGLCMIVTMFTTNDEFRQGTLIVLLGITIVMIIFGIWFLRNLIRGRASKCFSWWNWGYYVLILIAIVGTVVYTSFLDMYLWF